VCESLKERKIGWRKFWGRWRVKNNNAVCISVVIQNTILFFAGEDTASLVPTHLPWAWYKYIVFIFSYYIILSFSTAAIKTMIFTVGVRSVWWETRVIINNFTFDSTNKFRLREQIISFATLYSGFWIIIIITDVFWAVLVINRDPSFLENHNLRTRPRRIMSNLKRVSRHPLVYYPLYFSARG
jgi:hypothetical protein